MLARLKYFIARKFLRIFPKVMAKLPAAIAVKILLKIMPLEIITNVQGKDHVFCIDAAAFRKDINELIQVKSMNFIILDQFWFSVILAMFFSEFPFFSNHFYGVEKEFSSELKVAFDKAIYFLELLFCKLEEGAISIKYFLLPSFDQGGVALINQFARKNNKKVVSFYYEHYTFPVTKNVYTNCYSHYGSTSPGGTLLVWHQSGKDVLLKTKFASKKNIVIAGSPRLNRWFNVLKCSELPKKYITLLSFPGPEYFAPFTYTDILIALKRLADLYKEFEFVVKCKDSWHITQTNQVLQGGTGRLLLKSDIDMIDLLSQSKAVIGFNSLSFLEALLAQTHLILPYWGDSKHDPYLLQVDPNDSKAREIMDVANSREHFAELLEQRIAGDEYQGDMNKRVEYLNKYIYFDENNKSVDIFEKVFLENYEQN